MKAARIIRIALLLVVIFGAGVLTGRWSASPPPLGTAHRPAAAASDVTQAAEDALRRLSWHVRLDSPQQDRLRVIVTGVAEEMVLHPRGSRERWQLFEAAVPRMRAELRSDQLADFDRYVELTTRRFERSVRLQPVPDP